MAGGQYWSSEEDTKLAEAVGRLGTKAVCAHVQGRDPKSCRNRWHLNQLGSKGKAKGIGGKGQGRGLGRGQGRGQGRGHAGEGSEGRGQAAAGPSYDRGE